MDTTTTVYWQTWDQADAFNPGHDPGGSTTTLKGYNAAGASLSALYNGSDGQSQNGDLIELGYFDTGSAASTNTDSTGLFVGTWTPLTAKTTIGHKASSSFESVAGEYYFVTKFTQGSANINNALTNFAQSSPYGISDDTPANLNQSIGRLDTATNAGSSTYARLGVRFYDISPNSNTGGLSQVNGTSRYNTIMADSWQWGDTTTGNTEIKINLHDRSNPGNVDSNLKFEFDTSDGNGFGSKIGTDDNAVGTDDFAASITYHDGTSALNLSDAGIGSSVLSGLTGSATVYGANDANVLTLNSSKGNTHIYAGNIYNAGSGSDATDLTLIKSGAGTQVLTGNIKMADSTGSNESAYVNIAEGSLEFDAASGKTQIVEYLKGSGTLILDNSGRSDQTLELGFAQSHATSEATFTGAVTLQGGNTKNTIKVATGTTAADYSKEQVMSGVISGGEVLVKDGVGRLTLEGNNANTGGVEINNGTLAVGNGSDNADLGSGTITINKGKLEVLTGDTLSNQVVGGSDASKKSMIGGDGTLSYTTGDGIVIGSGSGEIDVISPGQGISSSLTETSGLTKDQAGFGNGVADNAIGSLTVSELRLKNGGVYDWELQDFDGTTGGTDYDVMNFTDLHFGAKTDRFTINILGIQSSDGNAGAPDNFGTTSRAGTNGFKFLDGSTSGSGITWTGGTQWTSAELNDYFVFNTNSVDFRTNNWEKGWEVYYSSGDFYLQYTATPEPSTYIMVAGLFMLPGYRMIKRMRKKFSSTSLGTEDEA